MDLTKITTPFGLLDAETQDSLIEAHKSGKTIEAFQCGGWETSPDPAAFPVWNCGTAYRVKPEPEQTTVWVNVWLSANDDDIWFDAWASQKDADDDANEPGYATLIARKTITIKHGEGL